MAHLDTSRLALRIVLKFCRKWIWNRYMKILFFEKKFYLGQFFFFLALRPFFLFDWTWSKLSQATVTIGSLNSQDMITFMITAGSLNSQDMISIFKQSRHDFSGKQLCDGYCMDIIWCLCVEVKIHGFVKLLWSLCLLYFIKFLFFSPNDSPLKTMKNAFFLI